MTSRASRSWPELFQSRAGSRSVRLLPAAGLGLTRLSLAAPDANGREVVHVVERPDPDAAAGEGPVGCLHQRRLEVVEVDGDPAGGHVADEPDGVPLVVPGHGLLVLRQRPAGSAVDDHDLAAGRVGLGSQVHVVKVLGILLVEEHAAVAVVARVPRALHLERDHGVGEFQPLDQRDVVGAADLGW